ncbi:hypothetical protein [Streptomyces sp. NPDC087272]|uniref:hypothetical protein n=1 Tax=Streptomyces sp. NPDC087272 TaxID=3365775 RepID=UPI00382CDD21
MPTHESAQEAAAELTRLTAALTRAEQELSKARTTLQEGIVKHLHARSAPPGELSDHTPYDRVHVGRLGKAAGVPPLRGPDAGPPPVYDEQTSREAYTELDKLTAAFNRAEVKVKKARGPLHEAIIRIYTERTLTREAIAKHTPYKRNHVGHIVKTAGAPAIRG